MRRQYALALLVGFLVSQLACGSSTKLSQVWADDTYDGGAIGSILIVGLTDDESRRRFFEREIGKQFEGSGVEATSSSSIFKTGSEPSVDEIRGACINRDIDAVLVTSLIAVDKHKEYVPGTSTTQVQEKTDYRTLSGYYATTYETVHTPGYMYEETKVLLENKLYDVARAELIWSAVSESFNPQSPEHVVDTLGKAILGELSQRRLIR